MGWGAGVCFTLLSRSVTLHIEWYMTCCEQRCFGDSPIIFSSDAITSENYWRITSRVNKTRYARQVIYHFISYMFAVELKHREIDENCHWAIAAPFLFTVSQSIVLLQSTETHYDVIWDDCPQNVSKLVTCAFPPSSGCHSLIIELDFTLWRVRNYPIDLDLQSYDSSNSMLINMDIGKGKLSMW